jgi:hypothetical protein
MINTFSIPISRAPTPNLRSTQKRNPDITGRYQYGGNTEQKGPWIGYWDGSILSTDVTDFTISIGAKYEKKPWLLAYDLYGSATLMWVVLQYNGIIDVDREFLSGLVLTLPTKSRLNSQILTKR